MDGKIGFRIVAALVLLAAIAGIGFFAYQAGVAHGSPVTIQAPAGESVPPNPYYGYGMPYHHPFGFGFGCFGLLLPLFLLLIALKAVRIMLWGPRWGHMHHHGPWGRNSGPPF